jgi:flagellin-like protein
VGKSLRSRRALSPIVASIILIAVTITISVAAAAWMGALSFNFMRTEELKIVSVEFYTKDGTKTIEVTVRNTGRSAVTITAVKVNGVDKIADTTVESGTAETGSGIRVDPATDVVLTITCDWELGMKYGVELQTASGNKFYYEATAPA